MKGRIRNLRKVVLRELNAPEASKVLGGTNVVTCGCVVTMTCDTAYPPTACNGDTSISNPSCYPTDCGGTTSFAVACSDICSSETCEC